MGYERNSNFRVLIFASDSSHGPSGLRAIIDDAKDIGVSAYANDVGEFFMTLPIVHPSLGQVVPLQRHYRVQRLNGSVYSTVASGLIEDFEAGDNEVTFYGHDYMGLLQTTISNSNSSYTSSTLGSVIQDQLSQALTESNSRLGFMSIGTIDATTVTTTLLTSYQPRLDFLRSIAEISMGDRSVRSILSIPRDPPFTWTFTENYGQSRPRVRLEYGGLVSNFRYLPGFRDYATRVRAVGVKQEGASILFSEQSYASEATYGRIVRPALYQNIINQAALDTRTKRAARRAGTADKGVSLVLRAGAIAPWVTYELGDDVRVIISRGSLTNVNGDYTIWGLEWTVSPNGRESLFLDLATKET